MAHWTESSAPPSGCAEECCCEHCRDEANQPATNWLMALCHRLLFAILPPFFHARVLHLHTKVRTVKSYGRQAWSSIWCSSTCAIVCHKTCQCRRRLTNKHNKERVILEKVKAVSLVWRDGNYKPICPHKSRSRCARVLVRDAKWSIERDWLPAK